MDRTDYRNVKGRLGGGGGNGRCRLTLPTNLASCVIDMATRAENTPHTTALGMAKK